MRTVLFLVLRLSNYNTLDEIEKGTSYWPWRQAQCGPVAHKNENKVQSLVGAYRFHYCGEFNLFGDNTARNNKFHCPIIDQMTLVYVQLCPQILKVYMYSKPQGGYMKLEIL